MNDEIVHGIPGPRELGEGDIVSLDFGAACEGYHGDSAVTVALGPVPAVAQKLVEVTRDALDRGIEQMVPGNRLSDIGHAVQVRAESEGFSVVRQFVGHGIGREMHEPPADPELRTRRGAVRGCGPAWCSRSSRWSRPARRTSRFSRTSGRR